MKSYIMEFYQRVKNHVILSRTLSTYTLEETIRYAEKSLRLHQDPYIINFNPKQDSLSIKIIEADFDEIEKRTIPIRTEMIVDYTFGTHKPFRMGSENIKRSTKVLNQWKRYLQGQNYLKEISRFFKHPSLVELSFLN